MPDPDQPNSRSASATPSRRRLRRTGLLALVALLSACSSSDADLTATATDGAASGTTSGPTSTGEGTLAVTLATGAESPLPLGEPLRVDRHGDQRRTSAASRHRSTLALVSPDGTRLPFYRTSLFVPFGDSASESIDGHDIAMVRRDRRLRDRGRGDRPCAPGRVGDAGLRRRAIDALDAVVRGRHRAGGLVTDVPVPECGQFSNGAAWGDVDGDGWHDLLVTRLGDPGAAVREPGRRQRSPTRAPSVGVAVDRRQRGRLRRLRQRRRCRPGAGRRRRRTCCLRNDGAGHFDDVTADGRCRRRRRAVG